MHFIVSADTEGVTTTEFTVAFQIRTPYRCRDRLDLHIIVSLGGNVSVIFILSNTWMKRIGAVLDYGANKLRVPLQDDPHHFRLTYHSPQNSFPSPYLSSSHEILFMLLPNIEGLLSVMTYLNPNFSLDRE